MSYYRPRERLQIAVRSAGDGFRIEVSSPVNLEARDILIRAQGLQIGPKGVTSQRAPLGAL